MFASNNFHLLFNFLFMYLSIPHKACFPHLELSQGRPEDVPGCRSQADLSKLSEIVEVVWYISSWLQSSAAQLW